MLEVTAEKTMSVSPKKTKEKISFEDYLVKYDGQHAEWIDGEVVLIYGEQNSNPDYNEKPNKSASYKHQDLCDFLIAVLRAFAEENDLGIVITAPMTMKLPTRGREPDIFFVSKNNLDRLKKTYLDGAADLIIEIISPESRGRDRGDKFYEYEKAGVKEYWLIDYERKQAEFYNLGKNGIYQVSQTDENQIYHSIVLKKLQLNVKWLWQKKLPSLIEVLKEWKLI